MKQQKQILSIILILVLVLAFSISLIGCSEKQEAGTIRLIEVTHSVFYAPLYVAIEAGYFTDEGLKIELTNGGGADNCMTALLTNAADIGLMGPEASIYILAEGKSDSPIIFGQLTKKDGSFLMGRTEDYDFEWSKLENKEIIGGRRGGVPALTVEHVLKKNNLINGTNITINYSIEYDLIGSAFQSGTGDYCTMFEPAATNMQNAGYGYIVASLGEAAGNYPYTAFSALSSYLTTNKADAESFLRAIIKGMDYVSNHTATEIATLIKGQFDGTTLLVLSSSIQSYKNIDAYSTSPIMAEADFNRLQQVIIEGNILTEGVEFSKLVDNTIAEGILNNG